MSDVFWAGYDKRPMGKGNPYYACIGCGRTDPEINGDIKRHGPGCPEAAKYLRESDPWDCTPFVAEGTVYPTGDDKIDYEFICDGSSISIKLTLRNYNGVFYPLSKPEVVFSSLLIATETFRDAVGLHRAQMILTDAEVPKDHIMWRLGKKG